MTQVLTQFKLAWIDYKKDWGLGRSSYLVILFNSTLFLYSGLALGTFSFRILIPVLVALTFLLVRSYAIAGTSVRLLVFTSIILYFVVGYNYYLVGILDGLAGGARRFDATFANFDLNLLGIPVANFIQNATKGTGAVAEVVYDLVMSSYLIYYLLPFYGVILYFRELNEENRYLLGRYAVSFIIYFTAQYLFYLMVPVSGPQFYLKEYFTAPLPLSGYGRALHGLISGAQTTFIDCFPSGHVGISLLVTIWLVRINHPQRVIMYAVTCSIATATLALRYHYLLDLAASLPLALLCYKLAHWMYPVSIAPHLRRRERT